MFVCRGTLPQWKVQVCAWCLWMQPQGWLHPPHPKKSPQSEPGYISVYIFHPLAFCWLPLVTVLLSADDFIRLAENLLIQTSYLCSCWSCCEGGLIYALLLMWELLRHTVRLVVETPEDVWICPSTTGRLSFIWFSIEALYSNVIEILSAGFRNMLRGKSVSFGKYVPVQFKVIGVYLIFFLSKQPFIIPCTSWGAVPQVGLFCPLAHCHHYIWKV